MSNVIGSVLNAREICKFLRSKGIVSVVDGSQAAAHLNVDFRDIDCDFYVITGHKIFGPTGTGILYIKEDRLGEMIPFNGGGAMIKSVTKENVFYNGKPVNFSPSPWPRSQDLYGLASLTFTINILKREDMISWGSCVGSSPYFYYLDKLESWDIDDQTDFDFCEFLYKKKHS